MLSGFLVGGLLFKELKREGRLDVRRFLLRRGLKIWPAYYMFLLIATFQLLRHSPYPTPRAALLHVLPNLIHLQNYLGTPFVITWTLSVEEHFYLLLPILIHLLSRRHLVALRRFPHIAVGTVVACNLLRLCNLPPNVGLATVSYYVGYRLSGYLPGPALWCLGMALYFGFAFVTGVVMARLIELPFLAWRDRILPSRSGTIAGP